MTQKFTYYMHDDGFWEYRDNLEAQGVTFPTEDAWGDFLDTRPFYEVTLDCEVDDEGNVTLIGARL